MSDMLREVALIRQCARLEDAVKRFELALDEARRAGRAEMVDEIREHVHYTGAAMRVLAGNLEALAKKERDSGH